MSNIGKGLLKMRFYSLAGYILLRKLEGLDVDETYTEELLELTFDTFEYSTLKNEAFKEDLNLYLKVIGDEFIQGDYPYIEKHLRSLNNFIGLFSEAFELESLTAEECGKLIKPLYDYLYMRQASHEQEEVK